MPAQFLLNGTDLGTSVIRLGQIPGWITNAELGGTGSCSVSLDDLAGTLTVTGWKSFIVNEFDAPYGNQRLFTGYVFDRNYSRSTSKSLIVGTSRDIDVNLTDQNAITSFRLIAPTDSTGNRPSETDVARLTWLLGTTYMPGVTDTTYFSSSGPITLDAADLRGQTADSVLSDCASNSGKNYFIWVNEAGGTLGLFYDFNYSAVYTSSAKFSNVLADINNTTVFKVGEDAVLNRDPSRVYSGVQVPFSGTGSPVYRTRSATALAFIARDTTAPTVNAKTTTQANALGDRYLTEIANEDNTLTFTAQMPAAHVNDVLAGQRVQVKATHLPDLSSYTYCRVLSREVKQDEESDQFYNVVYKMAPVGTAPAWPVPAVIAVGPFGFNLGPLLVGGPTGIQFSMSNPGDPTKRAYVYVTVGGSGATVIGDEFVIVPGPPNYNFSAVGDSTAGDGSQVQGSTTALTGLYSADTNHPAGLTYSFTVGTPVTFNFYVQYFAAGGLAYTTGVEHAHPYTYAGSLTSNPIPGMTTSYGLGSAGSTGPNGILFIGSTTMTYNP